MCHLQEILEEEQVKISKQLSYMRKLGMVTAKREGMWMVYALPEPPHNLVIENLKCLQDCKREYPFFKKDLNKRAAILKRIKKSQSKCPGVVLIKRSVCC